MIKKVNIRNSSKIHIFNKSKIREQNHCISVDKIAVKNYMIVPDNCEMFNSLNTLLPERVIKISF